MLGDAVGTAAAKDAYGRLMSAVSTGDESVLDELLAPDFVDHSPMPGQAPGADGLRQWLRAARTSLPDLRATVAAVVAEGDTLAGRVRYEGTHGGSLAGAPATGRRLAFDAFHFLRFREGKIVEWWGTADLLGALIQAGARVVPQPTGPPTDASAPPHGGQSGA